MMFGLAEHSKEIIVYEIYEDGVAKKDGRIQIGDQIVEINDKKASSLSNREVMMELRKRVDTIKLLIMSSAVNSNIQFVDYNRLKEMHFHKEQLIVNVVKRPGKFLGFSVASVWNNKGLAITSVLKKNRSIDEEEEWLVGDEIYSVNDVVLEDLPSEEAVLLIKILSGNLKIELHRMKIGLGHQTVELAYPLSPFSPTSFNAEFSFNPNAVKHSKIKRFFNEVVIQGPFYTDYATD
ncbi:hypothetical protein HELRODRAFT_171450 [Helobdella robusta]|uniref:PDZ domain-containing protein n=1 Tax=Helobdella robusta TaxID=6412 RepID=T1F4A6_HELRO|nr:hypothetical protein HELRODRAFT_171450 [Helobdella robusta]ESO05778.1 hypothetical protein HELRODRAFT_171450 [Helobdella robusta]